MLLRGPRHVRTIGCSRCRAGKGKKRAQTTYKLSRPEFPVDSRLKRFAARTPSVLECAAAVSQPTCIRSSNSSLRVVSQSRTSFISISSMTGFIDHAMVTSVASGVLVNSKRSSTRILAKLALWAGRSLCAFAFASVHLRSVPDSLLNLDMLFTYVVLYISISCAMHEKRGKGFRVSRSLAFCSLNQKCKL